MLGNKLTATQVYIWIITAMIGPILFFSSGNWVGILPAVVIISFLVWGTVRFGCHWDGPVYCVIQIVWIAVLLSQLLPFSAYCWPTGERTFPVIPLTLLLVASITAIKGSVPAANGVGIVFWVSIFLIGVVVLAGIPNIEIENIKISRKEIGGEMLLLFLLPATAGFLKKERCGVLPFAMVAFVATGIAVWICGTLSIEIADQHQWKFYEASKSVQLFNVAKRLESLVSVGVTLSNYALYSLLLCAAGEIGEKIGAERTAVIFAAGLSATLMLLKITILPSISVLIALILWVILPIMGFLKENEGK